MDNFIKTIKYHSWKNYLGPKTEFADSNIIPRGTSTDLKNCVGQGFSGGFTDVHGNKNISADKRTQKYFSFLLHIADPKKIIGHLLQNIEIDRLKLYGA